MNKRYDRAAEDVGNLVHLEHVNVTQPDQGPTTLFYVYGLGGTRDPYMMVELDNMWVNYGRTQMHLPSRDSQPQVLRGTMGFVVPDVAALKQRFERIAPRLQGTRFSWREKEGAVEANCPWGNRLRCHAPVAGFGAETELGMVYVEFDVPKGTAAGIARFYTQIMDAPATTIKRRGVPCARVPVGRGQALYFIETGKRLPPYDGHHIQVYIADFSGPYAKLRERGLITIETDAHEWRFQRIVDPDSGKALFEIEHEVRSLRHPLYARPLVNRNPLQTNRDYRRGQDAFRGTY
ncbi:MAG: hypothetical protein EXR31_08485 [Betaproteobacteria bacterium]|nr:hypothetical protein [Betaproteobacteria bacterium]